MSRARQTLAEMAVRVMTKVQIPDDGSAQAEDAKADIKELIQDFWYDTWEKRLWPQFIKESSIVLAAGENSFEVSECDPVLALVTTMRYGNLSLEFKDPTTINREDPGLWSYTGSPLVAVNLIDSVRLLGQWTEDVTLDLIGKEAFEELEDNDAPCLAIDDGLIAGAAGAFIMDNERDEARAAPFAATYQTKLQQLVDQFDGQAGNKKKIVPVAPWTSRNLRSRRSTSVIP